MLKNIIKPNYTSSQLEPVRDLVISEDSSERVYGRCLSYLKQSWINWLEKEVEVEDECDISKGCAQSSVDLIIGTAFFEAEGGDNMEERLKELKKAFDDHWEATVGELNR